MNLLRIPNLRDWRNEVIVWIGIVSGAAVWLADLVNAVDLTTQATAITSLVTVLLADFGSTQVSSAKTVAGVS